MEIIRKNQLLTQLLSEYDSVIQNLFNQKSINEETERNVEIAKLEAKLKLLKGNPKNTDDKKNIEKLEKLEKSRLLKNARQKRYTDKNQDKVKMYRANYRGNNKESIKEHNLEKITCECGCSITRISLSRHKKTKKHIDIINSN